MLAWIPDLDAVPHLGELPEGLRLERWDATGPLPRSAAEVGFVVMPFLSGPDPFDALRALPRLQVVQLLSAGADAAVGRVPDGVALCTAKGAHSAATAEWVLAVVLASVRELPRFVRAQEEGRWAYAPTGALAGSRVLVVGYGDIGRAVEARLAPFEVEVLRVARRARDGVAGLDDLPRLLPEADVVVVLVPLTADTRGMVDARFLTAMRDGALLVNAARGPVVDTAALVAELSSGRLRAALDVTDPEPLPEGHPLWSCPGLLLTPHVAGSTPLGTPRAYAVVGEQLRRWSAGETLVGVVGPEGY